MKERRDTSTRGDLSELEIAAALMRAGHRLLRPLSSASRYDLVIDNRDGSFVRVQCKTGVLRDGRITFRVYSVSGHTTRSSPYLDEVDAFGVYCPVTRGAYLVPIAAIGLRSGSVCLRVSPPRNGQVHGIHLAEAFLIGREERLTSV
jgi:hypothetical protein